MQQFCIYTLPTIQLYISIKLQERKKEVEEERRKTYIFKLNPDQEKTLWNLLLYGTVCQTENKLALTVSNGSVSQ